MIKANKDEHPYQTLFTFVMRWIDALQLGKVNEAVEMIDHDDVGLAIRVAQIEDEGAIVDPIEVEYDVFEVSFRYYPHREREYEVEFCLPNSALTTSVRLEFQELDEGFLVFLQSL